MPARVRRRFGRVRRLPSGRWQARYATPDRRDHAAPETFATKSAADRYLARVETDIDRGLWVDPSQGDIPFTAYASRWLGERPRPLRPRTLELYRGLLRIHLLPSLGSIPIGKITPSTVRTWHAELLADDVGPITVAKAYRLLRAILATAVADELILRNPCTLRGAGAERSPERTPPTIAEVGALAEAVDARFRVLVLLGAWSGLRWGELTALTRCDVDLLRGSVTVKAQHIESGGRISIGPPKTEAGRRTVVLPPHLVPEVTEHLGRYVEAAPDSLLFTSPLGSPLHRSNFSTHWRRAQQTTGLSGFRFHDLRHLAATLAATTGATTRELMARMGHSSPRAALIYQHASADRDADIAVALSELAAAAAVSPLARSAQIHK